MDEMQEAVQTVTKMSPPMLIIVVAAILSFILKAFLPEKYLWPISTVGGAAVAPYMFSPGSLAYDVPSPSTALVLVGAIMGFIGSVLHRRFDRWLRRKVAGDTEFTTRSDVSGDQPSVPPAENKPHSCRPAGAGEE